MGCQRVMYSCPKAFILKGLRVQAIGFTRNSCLLHLLSEWSDESNESSGVEINCHKIFWWVSEGGICGHIFARQIQKFIQTKKKGGGLLKLLRWCVLIVYDLLFWMTVPRFRDRQKQPLWACLLFEKTAAFWNWDLGRGRSFTTSSRTCSDQDNVRCIATWCDGASLHAPVWSILRWATSQQGKQQNSLPKSSRSESQDLETYSPYSLPSLFFTSWGTRLSWNNGNRSGITKYGSPGAAEWNSFKNYAFFCESEWPPCLVWRIFGILPILSKGTIVKIV